MDTLKGNNGKTSSMRVMAMLCVLSACGIGIMAVVLNRDLTGAGMLIGALLLPAFGGKSVQSFSERKQD